MREPTPPQNGYNPCGREQQRKASMALTNAPLGLAVGKTIEFVGLGPIGRKRSIDSFDYISQQPLQRVNVVAPPSQDWLALFAAWGISNLHVSLSIRSWNNLVLLTLNEVIPLHWSIQAVGVSGATVRALLSFGSQQVAIARVQPVAISRWDRYLPPSVQRGIPSGRFR
jgi:hypothetical protein